MLLFFLQVFGIDNRDGSIVWQRSLPRLSAFFNGVKHQPELPIFVLRTTAHFPYPPSIAIMGKESEVMISFISQFITSYTRGFGVNSGFFHDC